MNSKYTKYMDKSTKILLDELSEEYIERILEYIVEIKRIPVEDIKMRDIAQADERLMKNVDRKKDKSERYRKLLTTMGMLYAIIGVIFIIYDNYRFDFSQGTQFGITIMMAGIIISVLSYSLSTIKLFTSSNRKGKSSRNSDFRMLYISSWSEFESAARNKLLLLGVEENNNIRSLLKELIRFEILDENDLNTAQVLIRMRNEIVHGTKVEYENDIVRESLVALDELIWKVNNNEPN